MPGGGGGTPYVMGDTYVPRFWPPFFTLAGSSTIFLGYFSHPPTAKLSFGVQKLPIFTKVDLFGPKFNFSSIFLGPIFSGQRHTPISFQAEYPPGLLCGWSLGPEQFSRHKMRDSSLISVGFKTCIPCLLCHTGLRLHANCISHSCHCLISP